MMTRGRRHHPVPLALSQDSNFLVFRYDDGAAATACSKPFLAHRPARLCGNSYSPGTQQKKNTATATKTRRPNSEIDITPARAMLQLIICGSSNWIYRL
jgi:hypothetical protein